MLKLLLMQGNVLGYLQGPQDAAVTLQTVPVLEVPTVRHSQA